MGYAARGGYTAVFTHKQEEMNDSPQPKSDKALVFLKQTAQKQKELARMEQIQMEKERKAIEAALQLRRNAGKKYHAYIRPVEREAPKSETHLQKESAKRLKELQAAEEKKRLETEKAMKEALEKRRREQQKFNSYLHPKSTHATTQVVPIAEPMRRRQLVVPPPVPIAPVAAKGSVTGTSAAAPDFVAAPAVVPRPPSVPLPEPSCEPDSSIDHADAEVSLDEEEQQQARISTLASLDLRVAVQRPLSKRQEARADRRLRVSFKKRTSLLQSLDLASTCDSKTFASLRDFDDSDSDLSAEEHPREPARSQRSQQRGRYGMSDSEEDYSEAAQVSRKSVRLLHVLRKSRQLESSATFEALEELVQKQAWTPQLIVDALNAPQTPVKRPTKPLEQQPVPRGILKRDPAAKIAASKAQIDIPSAKDLIQRADEMLARHAMRKQQLQQHQQPQQQQQQSQSSRPMLTIDQMRLERQRKLESDLAALKSSPRYGDQDAQPKTTQKPAVAVSPVARIASAAPVPMKQAPPDALTAGVRYAASSGRTEGPKPVVVAVPQDRQHHHAAVPVLKPRAHVPAQHPSGVPVPLGAPRQRDHESPAAVVDRILGPPVLQRAPPTPEFRSAQDRYGRPGMHAEAAPRGGGCVSASTRERQLLQSLARLDAELWARASGAQNDENLDCDYGSGGAGMRYGESMATREQDGDQRLAPQPVVRGQYPAAAVAAPQRQQLVPVRVPVGRTKGDLPVKNRIRTRG